MFRKLALVIPGLTLVLLAGSAQSSGCCDAAPRWKLGLSVYTGFDNSVIAVPGNDTRANLVLLLADKSAPATASAIGPDVSPFTSWNGLRAKLTGAADPRSFSSGSRCDSNVAGTQAFEGAVAADLGMSAAEKNTLVALRRAMKPDCDNRQGSPPLDNATSGLSVAGKPFAIYLRGARAFYAGDFDIAALEFADLAKARSPWLRETALYMIARSALNAAQVGAFDDYGGIADPAKRDRAAIAAAEKGLNDYLKVYPRGDYAASARGLLRRTYWLAGDRKRLADSYRSLFAIRDRAARGIDDFTLAEEIDQKLLPGLTIDETTDPTLIAVADLMQMRGKDADFGSYAPDKPITLADIEAQRSLFAADKPLYDYVVASYAFHVAKQPADVLRLIPDATRQASFGSVQFSRQMLRGLALEATRDANVRGFWLAMFAGARQPYQRQAVELALAMHEERNGGIARVFAPASPVRDPGIRGILLGSGAGPDILRRLARDAKVPKAERETALFVLLVKQLGRGFYAGFVNDLRLVPPGAPARSGDFRAVTYREPDYDDPGAAPLGLFTAAGGYGDFGCQPLRDVAAALAENPRAPEQLICLAEFFRVSGFDHFPLDAELPRDELGGGPSLFPGKPYSRLEAYKLVIADTAAPANAKAYALYRAISCYAPGGTNDCGGIDVDRGQRRAWFLRLKRDYARTQWGKLEYFW